MSVQQWSKGQKNIDKRVKTHVLLYFSLCRSPFTRNFSGHYHSHYIVLRLAQRGRQLLIRNSSYIVSHLTHRWRHRVRRQAILFGELSVEFQLHCTHSHYPNSSGGGLREVLIRHRQLSARQARCI